MFSEWQFWFAVVNIVGTGLILAFNWFSHHKIVGNDLHHLAADVKEISSSQEELSKKVGRLAEDVGYLKGRIEVRTKQYAKKKLKV
jgi:peptidoglycan hydrolase CwlO-like protein